MTGGPLDQSTAPYLEAIVRYAERDPARFHVPGHKGGTGSDQAFRDAVGVEALALDLAQGLDGIDEGPGQTPYALAELLAAEAYGAQRSWFLTNGASQGNHALCLALAPLGRTIIAQRNSHASVVDGLVLSGGIPIFIEAEYDADLGMALGVDPQKLAALIVANPQAKAAFIVSPTYYGLTADIAGCAEVAHAAGVALIVDQSWGAHLGFHPALPPSALALGADAVLTSMHKLGGSMTQSAILHLGSAERIDEEALVRAIRILRSTSQNTLLIASLDAARRQLATRGEQLLTDTIERLTELRERLSAVPQLDLVDERMVGRSGIAGYDPLRVVLDVRGVGRSGVEFADALRRAYDVHPEMATQTEVVFVASLSESAQQLGRLAEAIEATVNRLARSGHTVPPIQPPGPSGGCVVSPREAFLGEAEIVPLAQAVGRISCESIAGYPPGIPALLPGERISAEVIDHLRQVVKTGAHMHGASDPELGTIAVLAEDRPA